MALLRSDDDDAMACRVEIVFDTDVKRESTGVRMNDIATTVGVYDYFGAHWDFTSEHEGPTGRGPRGERQEEQ